MKVMVQFDDAMTQAVRHSGIATTPGAVANPAAEMLRTVLGRFGTTAEPVHPNSPHPMLAQFFMIEATDRKTADALISELLLLAGVTAAYVAPEAQLP
jgi:hypothetical protein